MSDQLIALKDPKDVYDLVLKIYNEFQNVIAREVQPYDKGQRVLIVGRAVNLLHQQTFSTVLEVGERAIKDLDNIVKTEDLPWNQEKIREDEPILCEDVPCTQDDVEGFTIPFDDRN